MDNQQEHKISSSLKSENASAQRLDQYTINNFQRGRSAWIEVLWIFVQFSFFCTVMPGSSFRCFLLKLFGAKIGRSVVIKPRVRIKFPWKLVVGDDSWIGEDVWIDNLENVSIGCNTCISQGAYFCSGNHDWSKVNFDLRAEAIVIGDGVWIAARSVVGPGVKIGSGAVLGIGSVAVKNLDPWTINFGNPAQVVKKRRILP